MSEIDYKTAYETVLEATRIYYNEIERLKIIEEKYKDSQLYIKDFKDEIERLHSIIKEVREYITKHNETIRNRKELGVYGEFMIIPNELLEILDKENI